MAVKNTFLSEDIDIGSDCIWMSIGTQDRAHVLSGNPENVGLGKRKQKSGKNKKTENRKFHDAN